MAAVESLRTVAPAAEIVLITQETELPYYRLNLTRYLAGEVDRQGLFIRPAARYEEQQVRLLWERRSLTCIWLTTPSNCTTGGGLPLRSSCWRPAPAPSSRPSWEPINKESPACGPCTTPITSCKRASRAARCVCIGGGLLGLETAGALARRGAQVTLLEGHGWLLPRQLNQRAGEILGAHVGGIGITLRNRAVTREILETVVSAAFCSRTAARFLRSWW